MIEIVGGIFLLIGAYTRVVAFILAGDMAAAYFIAHLPRSFFPAVNGGDATVLYRLVFIYIFFAGSLIARCQSGTAGPACSSSEVRTHRGLCRRLISRKEAEAEAMRRGASGASSLLLSSASLLHGRWCGSGSGSDRHSDG